MRRTRIGPLDVSVLSLGAMLFGTETDEKMARRLLDAYVDRGGNFIDTSNNYAFWPANGRSGISEDVLGRWIRDRGRSDDLVIATKVGARPTFHGGGFNDIEGLSAAVIQENVDESLRRLQVDRIDLYYAHIDDRTTPIEETLAGFDAVVKAGKVRAIACSNYAVWRVEQARQVSRRLGLAEYVALQQHHSYFRPRPTSEPVISPIMDNRRGGWGATGGLSAQHLDYVREHPDFRVIAYTPLLRGAYSDPSRLPDDYKTRANAARSEALAIVAKETDATPNQVVLAWMLQSRPEIMPLIAVSRVDQLEENLGALELTLGEAMMNRLTVAG